MRCISPILIRKSGRHDFVPCGKCNFCLEVKRADWTFRLNQELKFAKSAKFLTMTYSDEKLPVNYAGVGYLRKDDVQKFMKRLRKRQSVIRGWSHGIRYYTVGEYGTETDRPHYHSVMFNMNLKLLDELPGIWSHGHVHIGEVNQASIHYTTKYVINRHLEDKLNAREPPFALISRGVGRDYLDTHRKWHRDDMRNYVQVNGVVGRLPRYYKDKMFTKFERELMAIENVPAGDQRYVEELERLSKFHEDPSYYLEECMRNDHERVSSKINSKNKF